MWQMTPSLGRIFKSVSPAKWRPIQPCPRQCPLSREARKVKSSPALLVRRTDNLSSFFCEGALLPCTGRQGKTSPSVHVPKSFLRGKGLGKGSSKLPPHQGPWPEIPWAKASPDPLEPTAVQAILRLLKILPPNELHSIGISMDLALVHQEAHTPVGCIPPFAKDWQQISRDPWILETIAGCKLEVSSVSRHTQFLSQFPVDKERSQVLKSFGWRARKAGSQAGHRTVVEPSWSMLYHSNVSCKQVRWVLETGHQSKKPTYVNWHTIVRHFKMESIRTAKGLLLKGEYMVKLDLKNACLSVPLYPHTGSSWPSAGESSFGGLKPCHSRWTGLLWIYQADKTNSGSRDKAGNLGHHVSGRYADIVNHTGRSQEKPCHSSRTFSHPRICGQHHARRMWLIQSL